MIKTVIGDILDAKEDIICHQVNCQGVMGSGLAKQIKAKYPEVYESYLQICKAYKPKPEKLLSFAQSVCCNDGKYVVNIFGQLNYGTKKVQTDYISLYKGLSSVFNAVTSITKYNSKTIAIPYKIGCGLAGGDWSVVYNFIEQLSEQYNYDITIYKLEE